MDKNNHIKTSAYKFKKEHLRRPQQTPIQVEIRLATDLGKRV